MKNCFSKKKRREDIPTQSQIVASLEHESEGDREIQFSKGQLVQRSPDGLKSLYFALDSKGKGLVVKEIYFGERSVQQENVYKNIVGLMNFQSSKLSHMHLVSYNFVEFK